MVSLMEYQNRCLNGPVMKADEFDLAFSMKVREVVDKYEIKYNPGELVVDDKTADAVFHAGVELLADVGLYHLNTQRVVKLTKEEIMAFVNERKKNPAKEEFGKGADKMTIQYRTGEDKRPPTVYVGVAGAISEDEFMPLCTAFAAERKIRGFGISGGITKVGNVEPKAGTISEIYCGKWEQEHLKKVLDEVGRPGMSLGLLCTVSTVGAIMHCMSDGFRGPHNTHIGVHVIPEQKIDWDRLILTHYCHDRGIVPWQSAMSLIGGLCRDAADTAVGLTANILGHMSYANGPMCSVFPNHIDGSWGTNPSIWAASAALRASERNIKIAMGSGPVGSWQWNYSPIGILQEALMALVYTASGFAYAWLGGCSPMEVVMMSDAMDKAVEIGPEASHDLAKKIMERIDELKKTEETLTSMLTFRDVYDLKTVTPLPKYEAQLERGREELARFGL